MPDKLLTALSLGGFLFGAAGVLTAPLHYAGYGICFLTFMVAQFIGKQSETADFKQLKLSRPLHFPLWLPCTLLIAWVMLANVLSAYPVNGKLNNLIYGIPVLWVSWIIGQHERARNWVGIGVCVGVLLSGTLAVLQYFIGYDPDIKPFRINPEGWINGRISGFMSNPIRFGTSMALSVVVLLVLRMKEKSWPYALPLIILACLSIALSASRGAFLALVAGTIVTLTLKFAFKKPLYVGLGVIVLLACVAAYVLLSPRDLSSLLQADQARLGLWEGTLHIIGQHPWFGVGPRGFDPAYNYGIDHYNYPPPSYGDAHNSFLQIAAISGIPSLILLCWLLIQSFAYFWKCRKAAPNAWVLGMGSLAVFIGGGLTENYIGLTTMRGFFFVIFGVALGWAYAANKSQNMTLEATPPS